MNRRIRRKKAKQLHREAKTQFVEAAALFTIAERFPVTGPVTEGIRQRALFRVRRRANEAAETFVEGSRLAR